MKGTWIVVFWRHSRQKQQSMFLCFRSEASPFAAAWGAAALTAAPPAAGQATQVAFVARENMLLLLAA
jgi:hypothetical protein